MTFSSGPIEFTLGPEKLMWWPAGRTFTVRCDEAPASGYILRFRRSALAAHLLADDELLQFYAICENFSRSQTPFLPLTDATMKKVSRTAQQMSRVWHGSEPFRNLSLKSCGLAIMNDLVRDASFRQARQGMLPLPHDQRMVDLLAWLDQNLGEQVTIDDLAERCGLGRSRFTQLFRAFTGRSPQDYIRRMRVASACRLLRHSGASVTAICYEVGFGSAARFHAAFQDILGMAPGQWRKSHETDEL